MNIIDQEQTDFETKVRQFFETEAFMINFYVDRLSFDCVREFLPHFSKDAFLLLVSSFSNKFTDKQKMEIRRYFNFYD